MSAFSAANGTFLTLPSEKHFRSEVVPAVLNAGFMLETVHNIKSVNVIQFGWLESKLRCLCMAFNVLGLEKICVVLFDFIGILATEAALKIDPCEPKQFSFQEHIYYFWTL